MFNHRTNIEQNLLHTSHLIHPVDVLSDPLLLFPGDSDLKFVEGQPTKPPCCLSALLPEMFHLDSSGFVVILC